MTIRMLKAWGCDVAVKNNSYVITPELYEVLNSPEQYAIEPDASAASYFFSAAAIAGGRVMVPSLHHDVLQGDIDFVDILALMGCEYREYQKEQMWVSHDIDRKRLIGVDVDMNAISDTVMTLAAVACFADSPTTIRNVAHIRHKETDRIAALATELRKLGVEIEEYPDGLKITPRPMKGCPLDTYNDHRMAMSLALIGLKVPGVVIRNPGCVAKTYPNFWDDFDSLSQST
jgi:3-phosphoshikimate 1-carboxyvinyltransferase